MTPRSRIHTTPERPKGLHRIPKAGAKARGKEGNASHNLSKKKFLMFQMKAATNIMKATVQNHAHTAGNTVA